jgi:NDP-4-keto-2,6-dideoxyhexose 3-C-methyltransferase
MLTGVFPVSIDENAVTRGPLQLVKCNEDSDDACGLVQLSCSYDLSEMYGVNYGYRSGLNLSMVEHLQSKINKIISQTSLEPGDLIIDIGSNDATTLKAYPENLSLELVGIDPTGIKFSEYYPDRITLVPEFFDVNLINKIYPGRKAKVITSFSMFYDLEDPTNFMSQIYEILDEDGVWVFEQSYMPLMLTTNSYDTICHEHLEFYGLRQIQYMAEKVGLHITDVEKNDINGGSFSVTARKRLEGDLINPSIKAILEEEARLNLGSLDPYHQFALRAENSKKQLLEFISAEKAKGKVFGALGASTKGNVLLQYCGLTSNEIEFIGEVNPEKFGCYTPGTWIPIIPENDLIEMRPDYLIVLPWHFKDFFLQNKKFSGINLVFPLPNLQVHKVK